MKKIINFIKKYKLYILSILFIFYFFRSCSRATQIKKLEKLNNKEVVTTDSLNLVINQKQQKIDSFPEILRNEKMNIHLEYNSWILEKDRSNQLMELHSIVKNNIKKLQK